MFLKNRIKTQLIVIWLSVFTHSISANSVFTLNKDELKIANHSFHGIAAVAISQDNLPYRNTSVKTSPSIIFMGQIGRLFLEGNRFGYMVDRTDFGALSIVGQVRSHQFLESRASNTTNKEKAVELGAQLAKPFKYGWVGQVSLFQDISDNHNGQELELAIYRRDEYKNFRLLTMFAAQQQSKSLSSYYADTESYKSGADLNFEIELIGVYELTERLNALFVYRHYLHGSGLSNSPLTDDDETKRLILGIGWSF